ncbi:MAG: hypothetical protein KJ041_10755, partial [Gammaproteobacteria bacterium]|nr:hypothetical protein [Gammaproteobacteria bacterium]
PPDFVPPEGSGYLILGRRARGDPARLAGVLGLARLDRPPLLVRPGSVAAGLRSLPAAVAQLWRGWRAVAASAVLPPARDLAAIIYRLLLGQCQARWWRDCGLRPDIVIYGHTGVADTTALELAQQATGCRTVHLVHGVSAGWNFTGLSSLGVFACGHDARWHERLPGYGATAWLAEPPPPVCLAGQGWVLLSNYIHPMNPRLAVDGPRQELELLDMVAGAAGRVAHRPARLVWKPHPTFGSVAAGIREAVLERLRGRGFAIWPDGDGLDAMAGFAAVLTTPSTVALDALRLGKVPVIVSTSPFQTDAAVGALPTRAEDETGLAGLIDAMAAPESYRRTFERCWASVQPGGRFTAEALARIVAMNPNGAVPGGSRTERAEA